MAGTEKENPSSLDVRVLMDVSKSLKKTDPHQLRGSSLRLLLDLLPTDSYVGVWGMDIKPVKIIPYGKAGVTWKSKAAALLQEMPKGASYTNMGKAMESMLKDWYGKNNNRERIIIVLTDGAVHVSKEAKINKIARNNILNIMLDRLRNYNVKVYTVALGERSDEALLKNIAAQTDGLYQKVPAAVGLQTAFFTIFESLLPSQRILLENKKFIVDKYVDGIRILSFRKLKKGGVAIRAPDGKIFKKTDKEPNINWVSARNYTIITIKNPDYGQWQLVGNVSSRSKVYVTSELKLKTTSIPKNIFQYEEILLRSKLQSDKAQEEGVEMKLLRKQKKGARTQAVSLKDNGKAGDLKAKDKIYTTTLYYKRKLGVNNVQFQARSKSFSRVYNHTVNVFRAPFDFERLSQMDSYPKTFRFLLKKNENLLTNYESVQFKMLLKQGNNVIRERIEHYPGGEEWMITLADLEPELNYSAEFTLVGKTLTGREFTLALPTKHFTAKIGSMVQRKAKKIVPTETSVKKIVKQKEPTTSEAILYGEEGEGNWKHAFLSSLVSIFFISFFVVIVGFAFSWRIKNKVRKIKERL